MKARKGCGPYNLGAPKPVGKKYGSPNKQIKKDVDPNLTPEESKLLDTDILSGSRLQELRGKRGPEFRNTLQRLQREQRAQDSSYIVNNRTIKDLKPVKNYSGKSSSLLSPQGASRPSKFKRDNQGNITKY